MSLVQKKSNANAREVVAKDSMEIRKEVKAIKVELVRERPIIADKQDTLCATARQKVNEARHMLYTGKLHTCIA